jgi:branched-chain amino acid transport system ATP-binding protein
MAEPLIPAPMLRTRGLTVRFGGVTAVDAVDVEIAPGELRCLIGPNGAGKSTFFKAVTGQIRPSAGTVEIAGKSTVGLERHEIARLRVGIKTQVPSVFDGLSVAQGLRIAARRAHAGADVEASVDALLDRLRLKAVARRSVAELSHGQRQWVELGMVLATDPALMLLDEPVAGMSDEETARTAELVKAMAGERAMLVVEHDMRFVRDIASRVTVLHRGAVLREGTVAEVLADETVRDVYLGREKSHA